MAAAPTVRQRLEAEGLTLPAAPRALGDYVPATRAGDLVFTSGQLPLRAGQLLATGMVGDVVDPEVAKGCARQAALNALAAASTVCDLDAVAGVVEVTGFVASSPTFVGQPGVVDGASAVMTAAFGESGRHARSAVGVAELPLGSPVEVEIVLRLS